MKLADFVSPDAIVPQLQSAERDDAVSELVDALVASGRLDASLKDDVIKKVIERENHGSTGFGKGVAVPHVKHDKVEQMCAAVGISQSGVDFNALDKAPVYSIVLLVSPKDKPDSHLQAMENIFTHLQKDTFRRFLRQATSKQDVQDLLAEADAQQFTGG